MINNMDVGTLADWKNVLADNEDNLINESNVNVVNATNCVDLTNISIGSTTHIDECDMSVLNKTGASMIRDKKFASFEKNFWVLDGSFFVLDDENNETIKGFVSGSLSDEYCNVSQYIYLNTSSKRQMHTIKFNPIYGFIPQTVALYSADKTVSYNLKELSANYNIENQQYIYLNNYNYTEMSDTIFLWVQKTNMPYRRVRIAEWNIGYKFFIDKNDLSSFEHSRTAKLNMTELPQNDVSFSFCDDKGYLDPLRTNQSFSYQFQKSNDFQVYYGYNLDNLGWSYSLVETLKFNEIEINRDSMETTIKLESPLNRWQVKYGSSALGLDTAPYNWSTLSGLITTIKYLNTGSTTAITGQNTLNNASTVKSSWRPLLRSINKNGNGTFVNANGNELMQQAVALGSGVLIRTENDWEIKKFVGADGKINNVSPATPDEHIYFRYCLNYPVVETQDKYKTGTFESASYDGQEADNTAQITVGGQTFTALPYRQKISLITNVTTNTDCDAVNDIFVVGYQGQTGVWNWDSGLHNIYLWYLTTFDCGDKVTIDSCILNPLIQIGDIVRIDTDENYANYQGIVEEITITYDGSFNGKIVINKPYME